MKSTPSVPDRWWDYVLISDRNLMHLVDVMNMDKRLYLPSWYIYIWSFISKFDCIHFIRVWGKRAIFNNNTNTRVCEIPVGQTASKAVSVKAVFSAVFLEFWGPERSYASRRCSPNRYLSFFKFFMTYTTVQWVRRIGKRKWIVPTNTNRAFKNDRSSKSTPQLNLKEKERERTNNTKQQNRNKQPCNQTNTRDFISTDNPQLTFGTSAAFILASRRYSCVPLSWILPCWISAICFLMSKTVSLLSSSLLSSSLLAFARENDSIFTTAESLCFIK